MLIKEMREQLRPSSGQKYQAWTTLKRKAVYGWTEASVRRQLVTVNFCGKTVSVHRLVASDLRHISATIRRWEHLNKKPHWVPKRIEAFNWRPIRNGKSLSRHAHAIAVDIDPVTNVYNGTKTDLPRHVIQIFINHGWAWGGNWNSPTDAMHFQKH